ncbi:hypothetical protein ACHAXR_012133 [Thalassiosira sp. AJA248-18]
MNMMLLSPTLVLAALVQHAAFDSSHALAPSFHNTHTLARRSSALSFSDGEHDSGPIFPPTRPAHLLQQWRRGAEEDAPPTAAEKSTVSSQQQQRRIPRRAIPHVENTSTAEAATRAGYIIRQREMTEGGNGKEKRLQTVKPRKQEAPSGVAQQAPGNNSIVDVHVRNRLTSRGSRLSLSRHPQLDEFLDKPEQLPPNEEERKGARRVTFKATRTASKSMLSKPLATLTEYMTQPVSQYSLLSFHDAEGGSSSSNSNSSRNNNENSKSRRWLVRRLTTEEAQRYIDSAASSERDGDMDESNLFRLAVPLLPLIGWDLTPVIDLEVIPPKSRDSVFTDDDAVSVDLDGTMSEVVSRGSNLEQSKWAPLKGIRKRMRSRGDGNEPDTETMDSGPPVVKIRSLRVSLLSTQEEVKEVMSNQNGGANNNNRRDRTMQKEAIEMVGKVEEWLRPHITFEAELSWDDGVSNSGGAAAVEKKEARSAVTVKSTAITSLTIPKLPSDIQLGGPSAFLVKRLGATLTSQALAICLPRFLRQLEKDYNRWSGLGLSADKVEKNSATSPEK